MNRRDEFADAAARAVDAQNARAKKCEGCGSTGQMAPHFLGCPTLPPIVPAERCPKCSRTPPYHSLDCPDNTLFKDAGGDIPAKTVSPEVTPPETQDTPEPSAALEASLAAGGPQPGDPDYVVSTWPTGNWSPRVAEMLHQRAAADLIPKPAPDVSRLARLLPEPEDVSFHVPGEVRVGSRVRCAECEEFHPCSAVTRAEQRQLTPEQLETLGEVDVGWFIDRRHADPLNASPRMVTGYEDDPTLGRIFTVVRMWRGFPQWEKLPAVEVDPDVIGPRNSNSARLTYRGLCAWVGKQTGTADEGEPQAIAAALLLSKTVI